MRRQKIQKNSLSSGSSYELSDLITEGNGNFRVSRILGRIVECNEGRLYRMPWGRFRHTATQMIDYLKAVCDSVDASQFITSTKFGIGTTRLLLLPLHDIEQAYLILFK